MESSYCQQAVTLFFFFFFLFFFFFFFFGLQLTAGLAPSLFGLLHRPWQVVLLYWYILCIFHNNSSSLATRAHMGRTALANYCEYIKQIKPNFMLYAGDQVTTGYGIFFLRSSRFSYTFMTPCITGFSLLTCP